MRCGGLLEPSFLKREDSVRYFSEMELFVLVFNYNSVGISQN
jgi:hypothetical protein